MFNKKILFLAGGLLLFTILSCKNSETKSDAAKADSLKTSSTTGKDSTQTLYTCPMHPEVISNQPGKCPKCGMDLEVKA